MPIFFVVAGFFGALLFYERKPLKMAKNRLSRIVFSIYCFFVNT
jgi:glucan biosynthesis protein C